MTIHIAKKNLWTQMLSGKSIGVIYRSTLHIRLLNDDEGVREVLTEGVAEKRHFSHRHERGVRCILLSRIDGSDLPVRGLSQAEDCNESGQYA